MTTSGGTFNRLIHEKSPYLLQHAYNPVDWYPWGEEAFGKARREDKPVFLSIGYSTCHWCHVMEKESFEDHEVADALNRDFVAVKVDREERPDIDAVYMRVCQAFTGSGGWPLTVLMTADQKPFFSGTYFPKHSRYGVPGLLELLHAVTAQWGNGRDKLLEAGEQLAGAAAAQDGGRGKSFTKELVREAKEILEQSFDRNDGGFGGRPKFPAPHNLLFLLRYCILEKDRGALAMAEKTLRQMYRGGIFDHVGFGFSRYSTDEKWLVPHFEKMLYDNALLVIAYLEAYQLTGAAFYKRVAKKTLRYVLREMTDGAGGFYSAQDADSEGEEGKYYALGREEIIDLLGEADGERFCRHFGMTEDGNFEGKNVLNLLHNEDYDKEDEKIEALSTRVYAYRLTRARLGKDDKILTAWNALMIAAMARAYQVLGGEEYLGAALDALALIEERLTGPDGRLFVRYRDNQAAGTGYLDDYAFLAWACLELYQATFDAAYLKKALACQRRMTEDFWDGENGGFYLYGAGGENLIARPKECYDGAIPSGNSVAAYVLLRLARLTGDPEWEQAAERQLRFLAGAADGYPAGYAFALIAGMLALYPSREVVCVVRNSSGELGGVRELLRERFVPQVTFLVKDASDSGAIEDVAGFVRPYGLKDGENTYYICEKGACLPPVSKAEELFEKLRP